MSSIIVIILGFAYVIVVIVVNRGRKVKAQVVRLRQRAGLPDTAMKAEDRRDRVGPG